MTAVPAGAIISGKINRIIRQFELAGATSAKNAKTAEELNIRKGFLFQRLVSQHVLIGVPQNRYFLNQANFINYRANRRKRILIFLIILFIIMISISLLHQ